MSWYDMISEPSLPSFTPDKEQKMTNLKSQMEENSPLQLPCEINNIIEAIDTQQNDIAKTNRSSNEPTLMVKSYNSHDNQSKTFRESTIQDRTLNFNKDDHKALLEHHQSLPKQHSVTSTEKNEYTMNLNSSPNLQYKRSRWKLLLI
jgi:hypothetical protein